MAGTGSVTAERGASFAALCADEAAFRTWYDGALPRVYGFVHGRTNGDIDLAEEITAQAFLEAVRARATFHDEADPVSWVCAIARNRLIDHYRRAAREQVGRLRLIVSDARDEDDAWAQVDRREAVIATLADLPPIERTTLVLRYLDGFSVRETAQLIGRSEKATESLLARARDRVRATTPGGPA